MPRFCCRHSARLSSPALHSHLAARPSCRPSWRVPRAPWRSPHRWRGECLHGLSSLPDLLLAAPGFVDTKSLSGKEESTMPKSKPPSTPKSGAPAPADGPSAPKGSLILRTLAMPADTNPNGDLFGGWLMSQMDIAGGILAKETAHSRVVTVAVDSFKFLKPVKVGDVVCCYGRVLRIGKTSIAIDLEVWVKSVLAETEEK